MRAVALFVVSLGLSVPSALAQPAQPRPADRPQGQIPDLGRPTESTDQVPLFDYDAYFPGVWTFEWRTPESPLSMGGTIRGTETYSESEDGRHYTSAIQADDPDGSFTAVSTIVYLREQRAFARFEADSRGFDMLKVGHVGGDLGGFYTIHYETAPFQARGKTVRLRLVTRLVSPVNYRVEARISVDDGPFSNFGTGWWQKQIDGQP